MDNIFPISHHQLNIHNPFPCSQEINTWSSFTAHFHLIVTLLMDNKFPISHHQLNIHYPLPCSQEINTWARWILSAVSYPMSSLSTVVLSSCFYLDLPSGTFPSDFVTQVCLHLSSAPSCCTLQPSVHPIIPHVVTLIMAGDYKL